MFALVCTGLGSVRHISGPCDPISLPNIFQFTNGNEAGLLMRLLRCGMQSKKLGFNMFTKRKIRLQVSFLFVNGKLGLISFK